MIKTWQQRCEEHPDHEGIVTEQMIRDRMQEELDELRKAAEMALKALESKHFKKDEHMLAVIEDALRQALAQPVDAVNISAERVDKTVKREHEPVAWANSSDLQNFDMRVRTNRDHYHTVPLYTAPPKREWVGLTDEEIYDYADKFLYQHGSNYGIKSFGKAIEAKLKEKNT